MKCMTFEESSQYLGNILDVQIKWLFQVLHRAGIVNENDLRRSDMISHSIQTKHRQTSASNDGGVRSTTLHTVRSSVERASLWKMMITACNNVNFQIHDQLNSQYLLQTAVHSDRTSSPCTARAGGRGSRGAVSEEEMRIDSH